MRVEVIYIDASKQFVESVDVRQGANVRDAIFSSGLLECCKDVSLDENLVGIFGKIVSLETLLSNDDRVEVYRCLVVDPMQARRIRAENKAG